MAEPSSQWIVRWQSWRWPALGAFAMVSFVLGFVGFRAYFDDIGATKSTSDLAYLSLQLFTLESGSVPDSGAPWSLEFARFSAPLASATALAAALAAAFREQLADWRLRRSRRHVVVCGLGETGTHVVRGLVGAGYGVVGVEVDAQNPAVLELQRSRVAVVVGDARLADTLRRARLDRATHLVCVAGEDETNAEVALRAADLTTSRHGTDLDCLVHVRDPDLCVLMRSEELGSGRRSGSRFDFFNLDELGARALLREHFPDPRDVAPGRSPCVLVVGLNRFAKSVVGALARHWHDHADDRRPVRIVMIDPSAHAAADQLSRENPQLGRVADLEPIDAEVDPLDADTIGDLSPLIAYVCIDRDSTAVQAALRTRYALGDETVPVVVGLAHASNLATVIDRPARMERIEVFDRLDRTTRPDLLLGGTYEMIARVIHEEYRAAQLLDADGEADDQSTVAWDDLPEGLKESNREQAAHIGTKLASIGCGLAPMADWEANAVEFTDRQLEQLAEMEHRRWVEERMRNGWTLGPKNVAAKTTPHLTPWNDLADDVKDLDRNAVRNIPQLVARAGYQIVSDRSHPA